MASVADEYQKLVDENLELRKKLRIARLAAYYALADREIIITDEAIDRGPKADLELMRNDVDRCWIVRRPTPPDSP